MVSQKSKGRSKKNTNRFKLQNYYRLTGDALSILELCEWRSLDLENEIIKEFPQYEKIITDNADYISYLLEQAVIIWGNKTKIIREKINKLNNDSLQKLILYYGSELFPKLYYYYKTCPDTKIKQECTRQLFKVLAIYLFATRDSNMRILIYLRDNKKSKYSKPIAYVSFEQFNRTMKRGKVESGKIKTAYLLTRDEGYLQNLKQYEAMLDETEQLLNLLVEGFKIDAEGITKGLSHPDDFAEDMKNKDWRKFIKGIKNRKKGFESFFHKTLEGFINKKFKDITDDDLQTKQYEWDNDLAYFPRRLRNMLMNEIKKEIKLKKKTIYADTIGRVKNKNEEYDFRYEVSNADGDQEDTYNPETIVIDKRNCEEAISHIKDEIVRYNNSLAIQAKPQKKLAEFLLNNDLNTYIDPARRCMKNQQISKDSGIPPRTVERFFKGLRKLKDSSKDSETIVRNPY